MDRDLDGKLKFDDDGKAKYRTIKERNKAICDQKANSVADMAAVLSRLAFIPEVVVKSKKESLKKKDPGYDPEVDKAERLARIANQPKKKESIGLIGDGEGKEVEVLWRDIHDAEFAAKWGDNVLHGQIPAPELRPRKIWEAKVSKTRVEEARRDADMERERDAIPVDKAKATEAQNAYENSEYRAKLSAEEQQAQDAKRAAARDEFLARCEEREARVAEWEAELTTRAETGEKEAEDIAELRPARDAEKQAAREVYQRRMAERAERIANDPEWYERVKEEGMRRKAEKGLL